MYTQTRILKIKANFKTNVKYEKIYLKKKSEVYADSNGIICFY